MNISKITTKYGVIKNPEPIIAKIVMIQPYNAKAIINKTLQKSIQRIREQGIKVVPTTFNIKCSKLHING